MKILTLTQPWASLVAIGAKRIETRAWSTPYRGPIAIHAAKTLNGIFRGAGPADLAEIVRREPFSSALAPLVRDVDEHEQRTLLGVMGRALDLPMGQIIAVAQLVDVQPTDVIVGRAVRQGEREFGDYSPGRFGWLLDNVVALDETIETRGMQGLTTLEPAIAEKVWKQLYAVEATR